MRNERENGSSLDQAAAKSGMCRQTAAKYRRANALPSELKKPHLWRTRENPFKETWPEVEELLKRSPGLGSKTIFSELTERYPNVFQEGQLRTLQRQIQRWRALNDDDSRYEVFFAQVHRPGEAAQTDFTHIKELLITIGGDPFAPLLCHTVLPYSHWESATRCSSESMQALKQGIQDAFFHLGKVTQWHQTDNSTSATHRVGGKRGFNRAYLDFMEHMGMQPRVIAVGKKEQNGSVEAQNGGLKRFLEQQLLLRDNRDFSSEEAFDAWLCSCLAKENARRSERLKEDLQAMRPLTAQRLDVCKEYSLRVSSNATINFRTNIYSVPPRLIGHSVKLQAHENKIVLLFGNVKIQEMPLLRGRSQQDINYRHVIHSLMRKPGAFTRYRYRECLFPSLTFKKAYEVIEQNQPGIKADVAYLRLLYLAATTSEIEVETAIDLALSEGKLPDPETIKNLVVMEKPTVPNIEALVVDLKAYDVLLERAA